jgi:hypothetical protein
MASATRGIRLRNKEIYAVSLTFTFTQSEQSRESFAITIILRSLITKNERKNLSK